MTDPTSEQLDKYSRWLNLAQSRRLVILESPYAGDVEANVIYARVCMRDSLARGEAPFLSHLLYTQVLNDSVEAERELGIACGVAWGRWASATVVYNDLGISRGMKFGMDRAKTEGRLVETRSLGPAWRPIK